MFSSGIFYVVCIMAFQLLSLLAHIVMQEYCTQYISGKRIDTKQYVQYALHDNTEICSIY